MQVIHWLHLEASSAPTPFLFWLRNLLHPAGWTFHLFTAGCGLWITQNIQCLSGSVEGVEGKEAIKEGLRHQVHPVY